MSLVILLNYAPCHYSQRIPSPSLSNPRSSGGNTVNTLSAALAQFRSRGGDAIHTSA